MDNVLAWFDLPREERPSFVTLYMSHVDNAGHAHMPGGPETIAAAEEADRHVGRLVEGLEARGLLDGVHIVIAPITA